MDVLTALLACSLYPQDDALVAAIARNAQDNVLFVYDPTIDPAQSDGPPAPHSVPEAVAQARAVIAKDAVPLLGLMQVPPLWVTGFGRELAEAFDPCTNIAIATDRLGAFDAECAHAERGAGGRSSTTRRSCVVAKYASAIGMPDLVTVVSLELRVHHAPPPPAFDAPIFAPDATRAWGPDRIFPPLLSSFLPPQGAHR